MKRTFNSWFTKVISIAALAFAAVFGFAAHAAYVAEVTTGGVTTQHETIADAVLALNTNGGTLTLLDNVSATSYTSSSPLEISKQGATFDLNGQTLTMGASEAFAITGSNVVLSNGIVTTTSGSYAVYLEGGYDVKIANVTILSGGIEIYVGSLEISGCTIEHPVKYGAISAGGGCDRHDQERHLFGSNGAGILDG